MQKIFFVHHRPGYGGASKSLDFFADALRAAGADVEVAFYDCDGAASGLSFKAAHKRGILKRFAQLKFLVEAARKHEAEIIVGLMPVNALMARLVAWWIGAIAVGSERGDPYSHQSIAERVKQFFLARCDLAIFQSEGAYDYYRRKLKGEAFIIPNSVAPSKKNVPFDSREDTIMYCGRFDVKNKRFDLLFKAISLVQKDHPNVHLNVYGDGSEEEERTVRELCVQEGVEPFVTFLGATDDVYAAMEAQKFFVISSDSEGVPNALLEAMACGMACVATDCSPGGARLLIEHNLSGLLVARGSAEELASALSSLLSSPDNSRDLAENARLRSAQFAPDRVSNLLTAAILRR